MPYLKMCRFLGALLGLLAGCQPAPRPGWSGYVEGDYVYLSAPLSGTLAQLAVRAGDQVTPGQPLFVLESENEQAARAEAEARLVRAQAQLANTAKGRRADELAVIQAQIAQARAQLSLTGAALAREEQLVQQGFVSQAKRDDLRAAQTQSRARLDELAAQLKVAGLPARSDERAGAAAEAEAARQALRQASWRTQQKTQQAPAGGLVADTFYRPGEWVAAGQPVLSLLPPSHIKVRFFVPEAALGRLPVGAAVNIVCDGCAAPLAARVSFIANRAEYTPPVIYSNAQRARLVFMAEALTSASDAVRLKPGQPVDVLPQGAAP